MDLTSVYLRLYEAVIWACTVERITWLFTITASSSVILLPRYHTRHTLYVQKNNMIFTKWKGKLRFTDVDHVSWTACVPFRPGVMFLIKLVGLGSKPSCLQSQETGDFIGVPIIDSFWRHSHHIYGTLFSKTHGSCKVDSCCHVIFFISVIAISDSSSLMGPTHPLRIETQSRKWQN